MHKGKTRIKRNSQRKYLDLTKAFSTSTNTILEIMAKNMGSWDKTLKNSIYKRFSKCLLTGLVASFTTWLPDLRLVLLGTDNCCVKSTTELSHLDPS